MKRLALAFAVCLAAGSALAQSAPPGPADGPESERDGATRGEYRDERRAGRGDDGPRHGYRNRDRGPRVERGARFRIQQDGEGSRVNIRCAEDETTRACVDEALRLLDRLVPPPGPPRP